MTVIVHVEKTMAGLDALTKRIDDATGRATSHVLEAFQDAGRAHTPIGDFPDNSTNPPGDLAESILIEGPEGGSGLYEGKVGPTLVYGRQRELGGPIDPVFAPILHFIWHGVETWSMHVEQEGAHYLRKGYDEVLPDVREIASIDINEAILGA